MRFAILLLMLCSLSSADEMSLVTLRASVARRGQPDVEPRGATEQLTVVKHQLRDWFESRLAGFGQHGDEGEFERKLNAELREAGLSCDDENANARLPCP